MKNIYVCSKLRGDLKNNIAKAINYCKLVVLKGHIPYAPHVYFTLFLDDTKEKDRKIGIKQGMEWLKLCSEIWVFDKEISEGMKYEIEYAKQNNIKIKKIK